MKKLLLAVLLFICSTSYGGITSILVENDRAKDNLDGFRLKVYGLQTDGSATDVILKTAAEKAKYPALETVFGLTPGKSLRCWLIFNDNGTVNRVDFQIKPEPLVIVDAVKAKADAIAVIDTTTPAKVGPPPAPEEPKVEEVIVP